MSGVTVVSRFIKHMREQDKGYGKLPRNDFVIPDVKAVYDMWSGKIPKGEAMRVLSDSCNNALVRRVQKIIEQWNIGTLKSNDDDFFTWQNQVKATKWDLLSCKLTPMPSTIEGNRLEFTYRVVLEFVEIDLDNYEIQTSSKLPILIKGVIVDYKAKSGFEIIHKKKIRRLYMELYDIWGVVNHKAFRDPPVEVKEITTVYDNEKTWDYSMEK